MPINDDPPDYDSWPSDWAYYAPSVYAPSKIPTDKLPKWGVQKVTASVVDEYLADGWEPFQYDHPFYHLRKRIV